MKPPNCIAILLDEEDNTPTIERNLLRLVNYIDFNSDEWDNELQRAFELLNELIDETSGAELLTNPGVKKLVEDMSNKRVAAITPKHVLRASVRYPDAHDYLGSDDEEVVRMLKDLEDESVLESRTYGRRVECRQCGDSDLTIELLCPRCDSNDIQKLSWLKNISNTNFLSKEVLCEFKLIFYFPTIYTKFKGIRFLLSNSGLSGLR